MTRPRAANELPLPEMSPAQLVEAPSQRIVAEALSPWQVDWQRIDMGIDGLCHPLGDPRENGNRAVVGEQFLIQLKGSARTTQNGASKDITVAHIHLWLRSSAPVMLVACPLPAGPAYFCWIDDAFVAWLNAKRPAWRNQKTVRVRLDDADQLGTRAHARILDYVRRRRGRPSTPLDPEVFLDAYALLNEVGRSLRILCESAGMRGPKAELDHLIGKLDGALYAVAVAGRTRAGKSSVINALLGRNLSPVGLLPTTAVPMFIQPGRVDSTQVVFNDGHTEEIAPDAEAVREFATQQGNPRNEKGVREVRVRLQSTRLDPGVMFVDAPGLADPNPAMRRATATAMQGVHAVVYVVDAAPLAHGGFALQETDVETLRGFADLDRTFIVLNKVDALSPEQCDILKDYVTNALKEHGLSGISPAPPILASARDALSGDDPGIDALSEHLWGFLLARGDIGVVRFERLCLGLRSVGAALRSSLVLGLNRGVQAQDLRSAAKRLHHAKEQAAEKWMRNFEERSLELDGAIGVEVQEVRDRCVAWLRGSSSDRPLPSPEEINARLFGEYSAVVQRGGADVAAWLECTNTVIEGELRAALQSEQLLAAPVPGPERPSTPTIALPVRQVLDEAMPQPFIGAAVVGGLAAALGLMESMFGGLLGFLAGWMWGESSRRQSKLLKYVRQVEEHSDAAKAEILGPLDAWLLQHRKLFLGRVADEFVGYTLDLDQRAAEAEDETHGDQEMLGAWRAEVETLELELERIAALPL